MEDNTAQILLSALAAWRIAHMIAWEAGPFWCFVKLRTLLGVEHNGEEPVSWGKAQEVFMCNLCGTVWLSTFFFLFWFVAPILVVIVAVWGIAAAIVKVSTWLDQQK